MAKKKKQKEKIFIQDKNIEIKQTILANCQYGQTRVAILTNSEITDLFIERESDENILGNIYMASITNIMPNLEAMFLDAGLEKSVYLSFNEIKNFDVQNYKKGDKLLIQITKGPINTKGAKATTNISFPGRYIVYAPLDEGIGVSKNISDDEKRDFLKTNVSKLAKKIQGGFICRTESEQIVDNADMIKILKSEIKTLLKIWEDINLKFNEQKLKNKTSELLHKDFNVLLKLVREKLNEKVEEFIIDSKSEYKEVLRFVKMISPNLQDKIKFYNDKKNLFEAYEIESVLNKIVRQKIYLKSGGYLIIQEAESLCAIDVNSGRTKGQNLEEVTLKTNLEAVKEIALQLRLRNIGGIIVIDFIDMYSEDQKEKILEAMKTAVQFDKAKIKILPITQMGLIEMTRQRKTESILSFLSEECPYCKGTGRIYSKDTIILNIKHDLLERIKDYANSKRKKKYRSFEILLNPDYKKFITKQKLSFLQNDISEMINIIYDYKININRYEIIIKDSNKEIKGEENERES
jgi:ribonuclease G